MPLGDAEKIEAKPLNSYGQQDKLEDAGFEHGQWQVFSALNPRLIQNLAEQGIIRPTTAQRASLYMFNSNRDVIVEAPSGTGKSTAGSIIALQKALSADSTSRIFYITETYVQSCEISGLLRVLGKDTGVKCGFVNAFTESVIDERSALPGMQISIGTFGAVNELVRRKVLTAKAISLIIIDIIKAKQMKKKIRMIHKVLYSGLSGIQMVILMRTSQIDESKWDFAKPSGPKPAHFLVDYEQCGTFKSPNCTFCDLNLANGLTEGLSIAGIRTMNPLHLRIIAPILEGCSAIIKGGNMEDRLLSLAIAVSSNLKLSSISCQVIVCSHNRSLAYRFSEILDTLDHKSRITVSVLSINPKIELPDQGATNAHVVIGSPGILFDYSSRKMLSLKKVRSLLILDGDKASSSKRMKLMERLLLKFNPKTQTIVLASSAAPGSSNPLECLVRNPPPIIYSFPNDNPNYILSPDMTPPSVALESPTLSPLSPQNSLDPATEHEERPTFQSLNIEELLLKGITQYGLRELSKIQARAIPSLVQGYNVNLRAPKNAGKSVALAVAALQIVNPLVFSCQVIISLPTTSDAVQLKALLGALGIYLNTFTYLVDSSVVKNTLPAAPTQPHIILGSLAHISSVVSSGLLPLSEVRVFAIDEADSEDFATKNSESVAEIIKLFPNKPQIVVLSNKL